MIISTIANIMGLVRYPLPRTYINLKLTSNLLRQNFCDTNKNKIAFSQAMQKYKDRLSTQQLSVQDHLNQFYQTFRYKDIDEQNESWKLLNQNIVSHCPIIPISERLKMLYWIDKIHLQNQLKIVLKQNLYDNFQQINKIEKIQSFSNLFYFLNRQKTLEQQKSQKFYQLLYDRLQRILPLHQAKNCEYFIVTDNTEQFYSYIAPDFKVIKISICLFNHLFYQLVNAKKKNYPFIDVLFRQLFQNKLNQLVLKYINLRKWGMHSFKTYYIWAEHKKQNQKQQIPPKYLKTCIQHIMMKQISITNLQFLEFFSLYQADIHRYLRNKPQHNQYYKLYSNMKFYATKVLNETDQKQLIKNKYPLSLFDWHIKAFLILAHLIQDDKISYTKFYPYFAINVTKIQNKHLFLILVKFKYLKASMKIQFNLYINAFWQQIWKRYPTFYDGFRKKIKCQLNNFLASQIKITVPKQIEQDLKKYIVPQSKFKKQKRNFKEKHQLQQQHQHQHQH